MILFSSVLSARMMEIHGHRGMKGKWKENTLVAFQHALEAGVDVIELDLAITKDGVVVVHHDPDVEDALICQMTFADLKKKDPALPSLEEVISFLKVHPKVHLNCDIKRDPLHPEKTLPAKDFAGHIMDVISRNDFSDRVYYTSFDPEILAAIRKLAPQATLGFIYDKKTLEEIRRRGHGDNFLAIMASKLKLSMLIPEHTLLKKEDVTKYHSLGYRVVTWTVNSSKRLQEVREMGVDGVITDDPVGAVRVFSEDR